MNAKSMTGYGAAERKLVEGTVRVELRALNHRFLELSLNLPSCLGRLEAEIRAVLIERVRRARVDVRITWEGRGVEGGQVVVNRELLGELYAQLEQARQALGIPGEVRIELLGRLPEVVRIGQSTIELGEASLASVIECVRSAVDALDLTRVAEGTALARDIEARLHTISGLVETAERTGEGEPQRLGERLRERVTVLLGEHRLDPDRLHQEIVLIAERIDVTEELVRLRHHLERASALLKSGEELGKPLDFLLQEIGRETNTLGSKSRAPEISGAVLAMKAEIEKIREQARNLE